MRSDGTILRIFRVEIYFFSENTSPTIVNLQTIDNTRACRIDNTRVRTRTVGPYRTVPGTIVRALYYSSPRFNGRRDQVSFK